MAAGLTRRGATVGAATLTTILASGAVEGAGSDAFSATVILASKELGTASAAGVPASFVGEIVQGAQIMYRFALIKSAIAAAITLSIITIGMAVVWSYLSESAQTTADKKAIQGEWEEVAKQQDGTDQPVEVVRQFNDRRFFENTKTRHLQTAPDGRELVSESGRFRLDASSTPKTIDFTLDVGTIRGIYELNGDELKLCVTKGGGLRPSAFQSKKGDNRVVIVLQRKK